MLRKVLWALISSSRASLLVWSVRSRPDLDWKDHLNKQSEVLELLFPVNEELTLVTRTCHLGSFNGVPASS